MSTIALQVTRRSLHSPDPGAGWWLSRTPAERIAHVEELRAEFYGWTDETESRLQRVCRVLHRA